MKGKDVAGLLDERPLSRLQIVVGLICVLVAVMDGFDTQAIGYVAPAIIQAWGIPKLTLGPVFSAGLIGSLLGALTFATLADRYGRRPILVICALIFGAAALASSLASSVPVLLVLRFITGLGLGGAMPIALAQTSEYMPQRVRGLAVTLAYVGFSLGAALGGVAADQLIRHFSWEAVFVAGGAPTLILVFCIAIWLPESIDFMLRQANRRESLARVLGKLRIDAGMVHEPASQRGKLGLTAAVTQLFADGRAAATTAIWLIVFMNLVELYFFTSWLPVIVHDTGMTVGDAALVTALFQIGGSAGAVVIGWLIDRFPKFTVLGCIYLGAALFVGSVGCVLAREHGPFVFVALAAVVTCAGVCVVGGQIGIIAATSTIYPAAVRTSGVGWALGIGRIGSVVGPFIGSALIANQLPVVELFAIGAVPAVIAGWSALWLGSFDTRRRQDQAVVTVQHAK
jgi:MFS transporter, AAHS family, 4-hydroxybenzoate transporter